MAAEINGIQLYYKEHGEKDGIPVVFLHGFPLENTMWEEQVKEFPRGYRAVFPDIRGFGNSGHGGGQCTMETYVDDLFALLDYLKIDATIFCGLSMGGYIVLRAYEREPERFKGMILSDTKSQADTNEGKISRAETVRAIKENGKEEFALNFSKAVLSENTLENNPYIQSEILETIHNTSDVGICGALIAMAGRTDTTHILKSINVPVCVMVGEFDKLTPPATVKKMAEEIPDAQFHIIKEASHLSNMENPKDFNEKLFDFLNVIT